MSAVHPLVHTLRAVSWVFKLVDRVYHKTTNVLRRVDKRVERAAFSFLGARPGTFGYPAYREAKLTEALALTPFVDKELPAGFGRHCDERLVEYPWLFDRLPKGPGRLLDAGSVLNFDLILKQPKLTEKKVTITTLAPEDQAHWWKSVSYTFEDIRELSFRDGYFDWVTCVSTLEHVGLDNARFYTSDTTKNQNRPSDYLLFLDQLRRVLKPGGTLYLTVPYGRYSHEGWLQVFDEQMIQTVVQRFAPAHYTAHYYRYDDGQWNVSTPKACADALYFGQKKLDSNPKGIVAAEAVCCLALKA